MGTGFDFGLLAQFVANGLVTGGVYALMAMGLTLIFGVMGVVNFAHGDFYILGGYLALFAAAALRLDFLTALIVAMLAVAAIGALAERLVFRPLPADDPSGAVITSFGLAVVMQNVALLLFGPQPQLIPTALSRVRYTIWEVTLTAQRALIPIVAAATVLLLHLVLRHTWTGRAMRAVAQNPTAARLSGVDPRGVALLTFGLGCALAAGAGGLMGTVFSFQPGTGSIIALKAFTVVILGGMGNVYGAAAAGVMLGVAESLTAGYLANDYRDIVAFLVVIALLVLRPEGLLGRSVVKV